MALCTECGGTGMRRNSALLRCPACNGSRVEPAETVRQRLDQMEETVVRLEREREEIARLVLGVETSIRLLVGGMPKDADTAADTLKATQCLVKIRSLCGLPAKLVASAGKLQRAPLVVLKGGLAADGGAL